MLNWVSYHLILSSGETAYRRFDPTEEGGSNGARGIRLPSPFDTNAPFSVASDLRRLLRVRKEALAICRDHRQSFFNSLSPFTSNTHSSIVFDLKKEVDRKAVWRLFKIYERLYFEFGFRPLHEAMNESQARTPVERSSPLDTA